MELHKNFDDVDDQQNPDYASAIDLDKPRHKNDRTT